ncbi:hypothetical protein Rsub_05741 [Raphidocelis subcapitata]|uniref:Snurportin-1 n=1 Tax=Raphidocelis subcapitata TaxID=307507 RepID=A0A2V0P742_9CHLO|nr:hypothetical protein Rsub_05741 [Raphidocelis subcapitata]|eukprot:GBF92905.1 hypothetical protein Rsub_05741 [Raphidocelis subcapitata]
MSSRGRPSIKAASDYGAYQQRRRDAALEQQRAARGSRLQLARVLAAERAEAAPGAEDDAAMGGGLEPPAAAPPAAAPAGAAVSGQGPGAAAGGRGGFGVGPADAGGLSGAELRHHYARQLMQPEWLTDVPPDLGSAWLVLPRPEGRRVLVVAAHGSTALRSRTGALLGRFQSALPGGSRASAGAGDFTVLDAVLADAPDGGGGAPPAAQQGQQQGQGQQEGQQQQLPQQQQQLQQHNHQQHHQQQQQQQQHALAGARLFLTDVLAWRGVDLAGCSAECRAFWLAGKMAEGGAAGGGAAGPGPSLEVLPALPATPEGLASAARGAAGGGALGFVQDGLLLLHREGQYSPGHSPLALLWKDEGCSRYLLDTDTDGIVPPRQAVVLAYRADGTVATADEPPVVLGRMPADWVATGAKLLRPGRLLRFSVGEGGVAFQGGRPSGADLKFEGAANQRRGRADAFSKVLFQALARGGEAPTLEQLQRAAAAAEAAAAADAGAAAGGGDADMGG